MIHDMQETMLLKLARSLTRKHIDPLNLERQKVKYAYTIFTPEVVAAIKLLTQSRVPEFVDSEETIVFLENIWKFWCYHEISNM